MVSEAGACALCVFAASVAGAVCVSRARCRGVVPRIGWALAPHERCDACVWVRGNDT